MWYLFITPIASIILALISGSTLVGAVSFLLLSLWIGPGIFLVAVPFIRRPVIRVKTDEPLVSLTFDDGPDPAYTPELIEILRTHGARATFFITADNAESHPDIVKALLADGHEIANHSSSHRHLLSLLPYRTQIADIGRAQGIIESVSGVTPRLYRPPMGYKTPETFRAADRLGLAVCGWSIKGWDTVITDPGKIAAHIVSCIRPGSIVLLHDAPTLKKNFTDRSATIDALPRILDGLKAQGLTSVTVSDLIQKEY